MVKLEVIDIVIIAVLPALSIALWMMADFTEKVRSSRWRMLWLVPGLICLSLVYIAGFEKLMIPAYLAAVILTAGLFKPEKKPRRAVSVIAAVLAVTALPLCLFDKSYRCADFVDSFNEGFTRMKANYVLADYKQVDWDALYEKYLPEFQAANKAHDKIANEIAWEKFCAEFHDLHVNFASSEENMEAAKKRAGGNDYGIVITTLEDGRTVAVQVDDSLACVGIHNGTEILTWDGMTPAEAEENSELRKMQNYADEDNEKFYEGFFAAGMGGDSVEVVYKDDDGSEREVQLSKISDDYYSRCKDAYNVINQGLNVGHMTVTKINDTTACLRIKTMSFDSISEKDEHMAMQNELRQNILDMKAQGIRDIVIDIRENNGGSGTMVKAVAQLFAPEGEHYYVTDAYWDKDTQSYVSEGENKWKTDTDITFDGENILGDDGRVVILVTEHSVSAADHLTKLMSTFDNTTVIGFTEPSGSAQGVSPITLDSGMFSFSSSLMLNQDGTIFIDSGTDYQSDNHLDIRVPYDEKAVRALFDDDRDYLMDYSLDYLENMER